MYTSFSNFNQKKIHSEKKCVENVIEVVRSRKIRPQAKIHNFAFKYSNIVIEGIIQKRKDYFR